MFHGRQGCEPFLQATVKVLASFRVVAGKAGVCFEEKELLHAIQQI